MNYDLIGDKELSYGTFFRELYNKYPVVVGGFVLKSHSERLINIYNATLNYKIHQFEDYTIVEERGTAIIFAKDYNDIEAILLRHTELFSVKTLGTDCIYIKAFRHGHITDILYKIDNKILNLYEDLDIQLLGSEFLNSQDYILFLFGDPGVGKSSIVNFIIQKFRDYTFYDLTKENILDPEDTIVLKNRLTHEKMVVILDDIYDDLSDRNNNPFIEKITSLTSGISANNLKIIITTNRPISKIDPVLVRAGRCFDFIKIEPMSREFALRVWQEQTNGDTSLTFDGDTITQAEFMEKLFLFKKPTNYRKYRNISANTKVGF